MEKTKSCGTCDNWDQSASGLARNCKRFNFIFGFMYGCDLWIEWNPESEKEKLRAIARSEYNKSLKFFVYTGILKSRKENDNAN